MKKKVSTVVFKCKLNYCIEKCNDFITNYEDPSLDEDATNGKLKYRIMIQRVANKQEKAIRIEVGDLETHFRGDPGFVQRVVGNTNRYVSLFSEVVDQVMPEKNINSPEGEIENTSSIIHKQRMENIEANNIKMRENFIHKKDKRNALPPQLSRHYELHIIRGENEKSKELKMRDIHADTIGSLVEFRGIVTKCSEVRPCIEVATYSCEA